MSLGPYLFAWQVPKRLPSTSWPCVSSPETCSHGECVGLLEGKLLTQIMSLLKESFRLAEGRLCRGGHPCLSTTHSNRLIAGHRWKALQRHAWPHRRASRTLFRGSTTTWRCSAAFPVSTATQSRKEAAGCTWVLWAGYTPQVDSWTKHVKDSRKGEFWLGCAGSPAPCLAAA